jgi:hypothetical protein
MEADHDRLKAWLVADAWTETPRDGGGGRLRTRLRAARARCGHDELGTDVAPVLRLAAAFDELALTI